MHYGGGWGGLGPQHIVGKEGPLVVWSPAVLGE